MLAFLAEYAPKHSDVFFAHATGNLYYEEFKGRAAELGLLDLPNVSIMEYIYDMPLWEAAADAVICRAGAMTISEMALGKKACVFIPSPNVTDNHQYANAKVLADADAAMLIEEKDLCAKTLADAIDRIRGDEAYARGMRENIEAFSFRGVAENIYNDIKKLMAEKKAAEGKE
jgi:UDP-N-acetylglucosamine--N-acetylmuramyl-(pentapeptide) pyrophosphoryl-undecaprenol N-acetylglucosamine transferase